MDRRPALVRPLELSVVLITLLAGCSLQHPLTAPDTGQAIAGKPAPDFAGTDLDGHGIKLADFRGHPLLISFWASWCGPCIAEQPGLTKLANEYAPKGLRVVGVDVRDEQGQARIFRDRYSMPYPSVFDQAGRLEFAYQVDAPPSVVLVDAGGTVRAKVIGALSEADLRQLLSDKLHLS